MHVDVPCASQRVLLGCPELFVALDAIVRCLIGMLVGASDAVLRVFGIAGNEVIAVCLSLEGMNPAAQARQAPRV